MNPAADPGDLVRLAGRTALVTGGCGAIGRATALLLRAAGARVTVLDRPGTGAPAHCELMPVDLATPEGLAAADGKVRAHEPSFDILVHAAGLTRDRMLWKMSDQDWTVVLRVHLDAAFHLLRAVAPGMREAGGGAVVLVSSINGERGKRGQANYTAAKGGLIALARTAARDLGAFGIRVNSVAPGWIETAMTADLPEEHRAAAVGETALGRLGSPEDVARSILFLCSDLAGHVTGQVLRVDGGQLMA